jgi:hypothetical protein
LRRGYSGWPAGCLGRIMRAATRKLHGGQN